MSVSTQHMERENRRTDKTKDEHGNDTERGRGREHGKSTEATGTQSQAHAAADIDERA